MILPFLLFSPFLCADLKLMASCFNTTLVDLEDELMTLILDGQIQARIDSHNKVNGADFKPVSLVLLSLSWRRRKCLGSKLALSLILFS